MRTILGLAIAASLAAPVFGQIQPAPANESPSQFYLRYRASIATATTIEQIVQQWSADDRQEFNAAPAAERVGLDVVKAFTASVTSVKVLKETATPNYATLDLEGIDSDKKAVRATIDLVRENGAWRLASGPERWR